MCPHHAAMHVGKQGHSGSQSEAAYNTHMVHVTVGPAGECALLAETPPTL